MHAVRKSPRLIETNVRLDTACLVNRTHLVKGIIYPVAAGALVFTSTTVQRDIFETPVRHASSSPWPSTPLSIFHKVFVLTSVMLRTLQSSSLTLRERVVSFGSCVQAPAKGDGPHRHAMGSSE